MNPPKSRLTPSRMGTLAARSTGSLKGLPYGPGWRQADYIKAFVAQRSQQEGGDAQNVPSRRDPPGGK